MAIVQNEYTGNGVTTLYSFTFPYIDDRDVRASIDGVLLDRDQYVFANATTLAFDTAPALGATLSIFRDTEIDTIPNVFYPGSAIRARDLNDNFTQTLFIIQESDKYATDADAVSKEAIQKADAAVVTANQADVNATAAVETANDAAAKSTSALGQANAAAADAQEALSTANTAISSAADAETNSTTAIETSLAAKATAEGAEADAQTAKSDAGAAVQTANTANANATSAVSTADTADTNASAALSAANTASVDAQDAVTTANIAISSAANAETNSTTALETALLAKSTADGAASDAQTAVGDASASVQTANIANTNASAAVSTADTAKSTADTANSTSSQALSTANAAAATADAANSKADGTNAAATAAQASAQTASEAAVTAESAAITASDAAITATTDAQTAVADASAALSTANTAKSTADTADANADTAIAESAQAVATANAAASAISDVVLYDLVPNVASIPSSPSAGSRVEVIDSSGIESFTPLTALPAGFVGDSKRLVRLSWDNSSSWVYNSYGINDPDARYVEKSGDNMTGSLTFGTNKISLDATGGSIVAAESASFAGDAVFIYGTNAPGTVRLGETTGTTYGGLAMYRSGQSSASTFFRCFSGASREQVFQINEEGTVKIGGALPASPNITLDASGSADFKGNVTLPGGGGATQALQKQEVESLISAIPTPDLTPYVEKAGSVMTGQLTLPGGGGATQALQKQEVESLISAIPTPPTPDLTPYVEKAGDNMTGDLTLGSGKITLDAGDGRITAASGDVIINSNASAAFGLGGNTSGTGSGVSIYGNTGQIKSFSNQATDNSILWSASRATSDASTKSEVFTLTADGSIDLAGSAAFADDAVFIYGADAPGTVRLGETTGTTYGGLTLYRSGQNSASTFFRCFSGPSRDQVFQIDETGTVGIGGTLPASPNITLNASGAAEFDGNLQVGGNPAAGTADGNKLYAQGGFAISASSGNLLQAFKTGTATPVCKIESSGAAEFVGNMTVGGQVSVSNAIVVDRTGASLFVGKKSGTATSEIFATGAASFTGRITAAGYALAGLPSLP